MNNGERHAPRPATRANGGTSTRPREPWRPAPKVRPCLKCGQPRISTAASDRLHPKSRPAGELNDGEAAAFVGPLR
jgi:hypothetical protein